MYIKENIFRLLIIFLIIIFGFGLFLTVKYLKNQATIATNPSSEVVKSGAFNIDTQTLDAVLKKIQ